MKSPNHTIRFSQLMIQFMIVNLSISTLVTVISQLFFIQFSFYAYLIVAIVTTNFIYLICQISKIKFNKYIIFLILTGVFTAFCAFIMHRPDHDDLAYVSNIIYFLNHPKVNLDLYNHFIYQEEGREMITYLFRSYELYQSAFSHVFSINYLDIYYIYHLLYVSFLVPFVLFLVVSLFTKNNSRALLTVLFLILLISLMGENHRAPSNYFLKRIFEGKTILLSIILPYFSYISISLFLNKSREYLVLIVLTTIAAFGSSLSSVALIPPLAFCLFLSFHFVIEKLKLKEITFYGLAVSPIVFYAILIILINPYDIGVDSPLNTGWPKNLSGHLNFLTRNEYYNSIWRPTSIFPLISIFLIITFSRSDKMRIFLIAWCFFIIIFFVNHFSARFLIDNIIGPNIYWRLYYIFPIVHLLGVAILIVLEKIEKLKNYKSLVIISILCLMLLNFNLNLFGRIETNVFKTNFKFHYKVDEIDYKESLQLSNIMESGSFLSNKDLLLILFTKGTFQTVNYREDILGKWFKRDEIITRIMAGRYCRDLKKEYFIPFKNCIKQFKPQFIIINKSKMNELTQSYLLKENYKLEFSTDKNLLYKNL